MCSSMTDLDIRDPGKAAADPPGDGAWPADCEAADAASGRPGTCSRRPQSTAHQPQTPQPGSEARAVHMRQGSGDATQASADQHMSVDFASEVPSSSIFRVLNSAFVRYHVAFWILQICTPSAGQGSYAYACVVGLHQRASIGFAHCAVCAVS